MDHTLPPAFSMTLQEWLNLPNKNMWKIKPYRDSHRCIGFGEDLQKVLRSLARALIRNHCRDMYYGNLKNGVLVTYDFQVVLSSTLQRIDLPLVLGLRKDIEDFISIVEEMYREYGPMMNGTPLDRPADLELFSKVVQFFFPVPLAIFGLRDMAFWVFNSPAFFVPGERYKFGLKVWDLHLQFAVVGSEINFDSEPYPLTDWMERIQEDHSGFLTNVFHNTNCTEPYTEKDIDRFVQNVFHNTLPHLILHAEEQLLKLYPEVFGRFYYGMLTFVENRPDFEMKSALQGHPKVFYWE